MDESGGSSWGFEEELEFLPIAPSCTPHPSYTSPTPSSILSTSSSILSTSSSYIVSTISPLFTSSQPPSLDFRSPQNRSSNATFCKIANNPGATIISPILFCLAGVTGHIWALIYLHKHSPRVASRTVFHIFLLTLMWTDFIGKLVTTFPVLTAYATGQWTGGKGMCDYHGFSMVLVSMVTHFTVASMAIERFLGICHGYFYGTHVTPLRSKYLLCGIWVFCSLFSLLPLFDVGQIFLHFPCSWCFANFHICHDTPARHRFFTMGLGIINVANLLITIVCNSLVVGSLLKMRVIRRVPEGIGQHRSRDKTDHELQMVVVLVVITIVFTTSWAMLDMMLLTSSTWAPHMKPEDHVMELIAVRLASISQIVDPWVYIICRVAFRSPLWRWCRRGIIGRWWSRREGRGSGSGSWRFHFSSLVHSRNSTKSTAMQETPPIHQNDATPELLLTPPSNPQLQSEVSNYESENQENHTDPTVQKYTNISLLNPDHIPLPHASSQPIHPDLPLNSQQQQPYTTHGRGRLTRSNSWVCPMSHSTSPKFQIYIP